VNLVGLDLNEIKKNEHLQPQVQFISGLGPKKARHFLERLKELGGGDILSRKKLDYLVKGPSVAKICAPFFRVETEFHRQLLERVDK